MIIKREYLVIVVGISLQNNFEMFYIRSESKMKKMYTSYDCHAVIKNKKDGTAQLTVRMPDGRKVKESIHKNFKAAEAAWRRFSN